MVERFALPRVDPYTDKKIFDVVSSACGEFKISPRGHGNLTIELETDTIALHGDVSNTLR